MQVWRVGRCSPHLALQVLTCVVLYSHCRTRVRQVLVNRLTFCKEHWSFVVLFGVAYVCPAWAINLRYDVWFYFFFEPRGRPLAPLVYLGLACILAGFFALGHEVSHALKPHML